MERTEQEQILWEEANAAGISELSDEDLNAFGEAIMYEQTELEQLWELAVNEKALRLLKEEKWAGKAKESLHRKESG